MTEDEMVGWRHRLNGHAFEQAPGVGHGQGSLMCCTPRDYKELDMTDREGSGTPLQNSCLENPMDRGVWQAAVHRVAKSQTGLSD